MDEVKDQQTQLLKGILEGCILLIISKEKTYGYEIIIKLHQYGLTSVSDGSIYPILLRLQKKGYIIGTKQKSSTGPSRKYYSLTIKGREYLNGFIKNWEQLCYVMNKLLEKNNIRNKDA